MDRNGQHANGALDAPGRAEPVEIWRARNFIRDYLTDELSLTRIAKAASISPGYLSEKFREVTGENLVRYISRRRVEAAEALLREGHRRISEIGFAVGFQSLSQFNRAFKKVTGMSPSAYRAAARHLPNDR